MNLIEQFIDLEELSQFHFLLEIALILVAVKIAGHLSKKIGQPAVFGELLVGVILGPSLLGWVQQSDMLRDLAEIGVILLMFLAGLETDVNEFKRTAYGSTLTAVGGVVLPLLAGFGIGLLFGYNYSTSIFLGTVLVATSVSISVQTLRELGKLQSKEGVTILGAAVLDDILGIITLSIVIGFVASDEGSGSLAGILFLLVKIIVFFLITILLGRTLLPRLFRAVSGLLTTEVVLTFGIVTALAFAYFAEMLGMAGIVGSYFAGLMLSLSNYREELFEKVETISFSFFVPIFFVSIGVTAQVQNFTMEILYFIVILTLVAVLTKLIGGGLGAKLAGFNWRSSTIIGAGMVARGEVGLIVATIGLQKGLIDQNLFTAAVIIVLVTTLVTPPALKAAIGRRQAEPSKN